LLLRSIGLTRRESGERGGGGWGWADSGRAGDVPRMGLALGRTIERDDYDVGVSDDDTPPGTPGA